MTRSHFDLTVDHFDKKFEQIDKRFDKVEVDIANTKYDMNEMKEDIAVMKEVQNKMMNLLDGYVKNNEDMKEEFYIMRWEVREIKRVIEEKLGVKIQAMR